MIGITGSTGILGRILVEKLNQTRLPYNCFSGDIADSTSVKKWVCSEKFDSIIHLAAVVPVSQVESNPVKAYQVNVGGMINLLEGIHVIDYPIWLFYSSTSHVYKSSDKPIEEGDAKEPVNTYGLTKYLAEQLLVNYAEKSNLNYCIGRVFSFYHSSQLKPFLYPSIIERLKQEDLSKPFVLKGANSERDIMNAEEIIDVILSLMKVKANGIYNIGSGKGIKIRDFVQKISETKLTIEPDPEIKEDSLVADISKLRNVLSL